MEPRQERTELRSIVVRRDHPALLAMLERFPWPEQMLQVIGDGLLAALAASVAEAADPARRCAMELRDRDWDGDGELADALAAAVGDGSTPMLRALTVDLEQLSAVLEGDPMNGDGYLDLTTGEAWPAELLDPAMAGEAAIDIEEDPDRWLLVTSEGSRAGYRDMEFFIDGVGDADLAERLSRAISGRGAFRRFRDRVADQPELFTRWQGFSDERRLGRARRWLADKGYTPGFPAS